MAVKIDAFVALEASLALRLTSTMQQLVGPVFASVQKLIEAEDWEAATALLQKVDLTEVFDLNRPYIEYISQVAILFGASRISRTPRTSVVGLGFEQDTVELVVDSFRQQVLVGATNYLKDAGGDVSHTKTVPVVIEEAITR